MVQFGASQEGYCSDRAAQVTGTACATPDGPEDLLPGGDLSKAQER